MAWDSTEWEREAEDIAHENGQAWQKAQNLPPLATQRVEAQTVKAKRVSPRKATLAAKARKRMSS